MASLLGKLPKLPFSKKPAPVEEGGIEKEMTIFGHLAELRDRLVICCIALGITVAFSFFFTEHLIRILLMPSGLERLQTINPTENFTTYMQVAFIAGFIMSLPILTWQIVSYISPGLYDLERKILYSLLPGITLFFLAGAAFSYFAMLPAALYFLRNFGGELFDANWRAAEYLDLVTQLIFWTGLVFETPLVLFVAAKLNLVRTEQLTRYRKYAFLMAYIIGAMITPTADPINMTIVAIPVYLLFELGVFLTRFA